MPFSAPVLTYRAKALASNMCSKVLNGHIILTDTSITTILAPEMTYTPKCIGRSSDLFRFYAFPALRPVAKIVKPFAPHVWGRNSQQRVLSQILTAFPFHSSSRNRRFGNLCDGKYTNFCLLGIFDTKKKCNPVSWVFYSYESYLSDLRF